MEVMFSWSKPNIHNRLSFFNRFLELRLSEFINEFELMAQVYREKSVNIDCQKYILVLDYIIKIFNSISNILKRNSNYQMNNYYDTG